MEKEFTLHLLGRFELTSATAGQIGISAKKSRALVCYLALSPDGTASRDRLASLLWSDTELQFAKTNLRQCLSALRRQIDNKTSGLVRNEGDQLQLHLKKLRIDTDLLGTLKNASVGDALPLLPDLNRGALLPDFPAIDSQFDEWLDRQRYHFQDGYCRALEQILSDAGVDRRTFNQGDAVASRATIKLAREILEVEAANEKAHTCLVKHYLQIGDRAAALRQYGICEQVLADQLDVEPGSELKALIETVRQPTSIVAGKVAVTAGKVAKKKKLAVKKLAVKRLAVERLRVK